MQVATRSLAAPTAAAAKERRRLRFTIPSLLQLVCMDAGAVDCAAWQFALLVGRVGEDRPAARRIESVAAIVDGRDRCGSDTSCDRLEGLSWMSKQVKINTGRAPRPSATMAEGRRMERAESRSAFSDDSQLRVFSAAQARNFDGLFFSTG